MAQPNFKPERLVDKAYRRSAQHRHCAVRHPETGDYCSGDGVVLAHVRTLNNAGTGLKPPDDESLFLCGKHHDEFDGRARRGMHYPGEAEDRYRWLVQNIVIPERKQAYRAYKIGTGR